VAFGFEPFCQGQSAGLDEIEALTFRADVELEDMYWMVLVCESVCVATVLGVFLGVSQRNAGSEHGLLRAVVTTRQRPMRQIA
jgi:hypothetical protein